jgi:copper chaperone CopZ
MKKIFLILLFGSAVLTSKAQLEKIQFQASGLTCSMCSNAINQALKTIPFIASISVDLNKDIFEITLKKNQPVDLDLIQKKVEDAGFSLAKCWIWMDLHNLKIDNDGHFVIDGINYHFVHVKTQTLNGEQRLQVIDKKYVLYREYKRNSGFTNMPCYKSGLMESCCKSTGGLPPSARRIFHVTI